ncbi:hypothetical protein KJ965_05480, partial [Patescibacteria group bacterium]|nr:hypothetical protein [Patescibacteria group bacterium]
MTRDSDLILPEEKAPFNYGCHPKFEHSCKRFYREMVKRARQGKPYDKNRVSLTSLSKSGNVYLVPRDIYIDVIDETGDMVAVGNMDKAMFPFSSYDFY